jgi:hypothetical protein
MVAISLMLMATSKSMEVISEKKCREQKQIEIYNVIISNQTSTKHIKNKLIFCSQKSLLTRLFDRRTKLYTTKSNNYLVRHLNKTYQINMKEKLIPKSRLLYE